MQPCAVLVDDHGALAIVIPATQKTSHSTGKVRVAALERLIQ
jgi:hypothetical protein